MEYERKESLLKEELVTRQQFDDISTRLTVADRDLDRAKALLSLAREKLGQDRHLLAHTGDGEGEDGDGG